MWQPQYSIQRRLAGALAVELAMVTCERSTGSSPKGARDGLVDGVALAGRLSCESSRRRRCDRRRGPPPA